MSFEGWLLYAECMIELADLKGALVAIDLAPNLPDLPYITLPEAQMEYDLSIPADLTSSDCFQYCMLPIDDMMDYSVSGTLSEKICILSLNQF